MGNFNDAKSQKNFIVENYFEKNDIHKRKKCFRGVKSKKYKTQNNIRKFQSAKMFTPCTQNAIFKQNLTQQKKKIYINESKELQQSINFCQDFLQQFYLNNANQTINSFCILIGASIKQEECRSIEKFFNPNTVNLIVSNKQKSLIFSDILRQEIQYWIEQSKTQFQEDHLYYKQTRNNNYEYEIDKTINKNLYKGFFQFNQRKDQKLFNKKQDFNNQDERENKCQSQILQMIQNHKIQQQKESNNFDLIQSINQRPNILQKLKNSGKKQMLKLRQSQKSFENYNSNQKEQNISVPFSGYKKNNTSLISKISFKNKDLTEESSSDSIYEEILDDIQYKRQFVFQKQHILEGNSQNGRNSSQKSIKIDIYKLINQN